MENLKKRMKSRWVWVALFSFIALTGQTFNIYQVPDGYNEWVNGLLAFLTAAGILTMDPIDTDSDDDGE